MEKSRDGHGKGKGMAKDRLNWKWKLVIAVVALLLIAVGFFFSTYGFRTMQGWINKAYEKTPPQQRKDHPAGDWYARLAWFEGYLCGRRLLANDAYKDFLGIQDTNGVTFWTHLSRGGRPRWKGKFDPKTQTGWGILHPKSPDAFWQYMELNNNWGSTQSNADMGRLYYHLFYRYYRYYTKGHRPHPRFYVYWKKVLNRYILPDHRARGFTLPREKPKDMAGPEEE